MVRRLCFIIRTLSKQCDKFFNESYDPRFHSFQRLLRHGLRYDSSLEAINSLIGRADQIGRAAGAQRSIALTFDDIRPNTVDLHCSIKAEEGKRIWAMSYNLACERINPSSISVPCRQTAGSMTRTYHNLSAILSEH